MLMEMLCILDSVSVNIMVVVLYYGFTGVYHRGKLGKGYMSSSALLLTTACDSTILSK